MTFNTKPAAFYADFAGLTELKGAARNQDPKALREAARQFEGLFTQMMLKSMRQASDALPGGDSPMENDQTAMYRDMFDNQLALQLAKGRGLGLADMLVRQVTPAGLAKAEVKSPALHPTSHPTLLPAYRSELSPAMSLPKPQFLQSPIPQSPIPQPSTPQDQGAEFVPLSLPYLQTPSESQAIVAAVATSKSASQNPLSATRVLAPTDLAPMKDSARPQPLAKNAADFVKQLWPHAQKAARELGVDAKTLIAHAALETGWGKFVPCNPDGSCSFNLFGIKATGRWTGATTAVNTLEFEAGVAVKKRASFRTYESAADSFRDYASLIKNSPRYAAAVGAGGDASAFATALQQGGYATDPQYATKLAATAARLQSMEPIHPEKYESLKLADNGPLIAGSSLSAGDRK